MTSTQPSAHATFSSQKKFKLCYADPPWSHAQQGARGASQHYSLMTIEDIKAMPIADLMDDNSTLLLWTTNAALPDALDVVKAWGFEIGRAHV